MACKCDIRGTTICACKHRFGTMAQRAASTSLHMHSGCTLAGTLVLAPHLAKVTFCKKGVTASVVAIIERRRKMAFLFVILLVLCPVPPFFSERHASTHDQRSQPLSSWVRTDWNPFTSVDRVECFSRQLMTPIFIVHLSWIVGLLLLFTVVLADLFLKLVFISCTLGVTWYSSSGKSAR